MKIINGVVYLEPDERITKKKISDSAWIKMGKGGKWSKRSDQWRNQGKRPGAKK